MNKTSIEWTDATWNPIRAALKGFQSPEDAKRTIRKGTFCTRISPGCTNCYASVINKRFGNGLEYTVPNLEKIEFYLDEKILAEPLKQKKPARIFVGDMFDLFHEAIPDGMIQRVIGTAINAEYHSFQFLTKRAERMQLLIGGDFGVNAYGAPKNCWFGVSVESPNYKDRIDLLRDTPAALRFLSLEPCLADYGTLNLSGIHWAIFGGESGPGARACSITWAENVQRQCREQNVAFFMKQVGSNPMPLRVESGSVTERLWLKDRKGGDPSEWPEHLRVREFPTLKTAEVLA